MTVPPVPEGTRPSGSQVPPGDPRVDASTPLPPEEGSPPLGSWQTYAPPGDEPPERVPVKYGIIAILAVVLIGVIGVGVAVWSTTWAPKTSAASIWTSGPAVASTTPSRASSQSQPKTANCKGSDAGTPDWYATVPPGWSCQYVAGREIYIMDDTYDTIDVSAATQSPASACSSAHLFQGTSSVTPLPTTMWGQKSATTVGFKYQSWIGQARCVSALGYTYVMVGTVYGGTLDTIVKAETSLAESWDWNA